MLDPLDPPGTLFGTLCTGVQEHAWRRPERVLMSLGGPVATHSV
jgi:hypothetical protein